MQKNLPLLVLLIGILLLAGCAGNTEERGGGGPVAGDAGQAPGQADSDANKIVTEKNENVYRMWECVYNVIGTRNGKTIYGTSTTSNRPDSVDGKPARLVFIETKLSDGRVLVEMKTWIDPDSLCLKIMSSMTVDGETVNLGDTCPGGEMKFFKILEGASFVNEGNETITVPFGTYSADKYTLGGMSFWISEEVPVPLKAWDGEAMMELVSYRE